MCWSRECARLARRDGRPTRMPWYAELRTLALEVELTGEDASAVVRIAAGGPTADRGRARQQRARRVELTINPERDAAGQSVVKEPQLPAAVSAHGEVAQVKNRAHTTTTAIGRQSFPAIAAFVGVLTAAAAGSFPDATRYRPGFSLATPAMLKPSSDAVEYADRAAPRPRGRDERWCRPHPTVEDRRLHGSVAICAGLRRKCYTNGEALTQTVESTV